MNRYRWTQPGRLVLLCALVVPANALSAVIHVPGDQPTIQAGLNAAAAGDTVLVAAGTYQGNGNTGLQFGGTDRVLLSENGPDVTIIDCALAARGFLFVGGETTASIVDGFTIRNGLLDDDGGAIICQLANPTIRNCHFIDNSADSGGAIWIAGASPAITACTFSGNYAGGNSTYAGRGGAIWCANLAAPTISDCSFDGNSGRRGGAIWCSGNASPVIEGCTFTGNVAIGMGGAVMSFGETSAPHFTSCVFTSNTATSVGGGYATIGSPPVFDDCTFVDNTAGTRGGACFANSGVLTFNGCVFDGNASSQGGAVQLLDATAVLDRCTLHASDAPLGGGIHVWGVTVPADASIENTIIAFGTAGEALRCEGDADATMSCSDVFGNAGGDWVGCLAGQLGVAGNIAEDPLFCDATGGDLRIEATSPCAPPQSGSCGLIGARPAGCGTTAIDPGPAPAVRVALRVFPNPLRPGSGIVEWDAPAAQDVTLKLYDAVGRHVLSRDHRPDGTGPQRVAWSQLLGGHALPSGVYFLRIEGLVTPVAPLRVVWTR